MPLLPGKKNVGKNISELEGAGHPHKQAIAIALDVARRARAEGGAVEDRVFTGPVNMAVPGRTDRIPVHVPSGSYVLPADIVSSLGEGNTLAGFKAVKRMFEGGGVYGEKIRRRAAAGGFVGDGKTVPVIVAGGEYIIPPEVVDAIGDGDMKKGHAILDDFVKSRRKQTVKHLKSLPGPAKD